MPVQINELIIRAHVNEHEETPKAAVDTGATKEDKEAIIRECIERVMEIIEHQNER